MPLQQKLKILKENLKALPGLAIAFSGGVDSSFLLKLSCEVLQDKVIAITALSSTYPQYEQEEAARFCAELGVRHIMVPCEQLDVPGFADNPVNRCYLCKRHLFGIIFKLARENGFETVADGSNLDDKGDFRPGMKASQEFGVVSPLLQAGLTKMEIRQLAREMGMPDWDKPASACLSSRFVYGEKITREKLRMVEAAEQYLRSLRMRQVRVRVHDNLARIEIAPDERTRFFDQILLDKISQEFRYIGFRYVTLDLQGYRTGSMNESLDIGADGACRAQKAEVHS